ncbi:serine/threonine-protein kinase Wnk isoform X2 [Drosophila takahashii]|uniref:serine/threonine-protein kinase Wnk isoform X2 n=1 Tax=Drosophila takahashii TaxID=29030 RepID=UPI003899559E
MPNEVRPTRPSPYWRHASPARRTTTLKSDFTPEQASNGIGQHLLRTLVQSLPSGAEPTRSRSSCPPTSRRRRQVSGCRSMGTPESLSSPGRIKAPVRLQAGMPVQQVKSSKVIGLGRNAQHSMVASLKRRSESPTAKAKAREEEFDRLPEMITGTATAKAREEEFEKIPSKISSMNQEVKEAEDESQKNSEPEIQENPEQEALENLEPEAPKNSKPNSLENLNKNSEESANTKTEEAQPEEPEISAKEPEQQKPVSVVNSKIIPCFRGEYPTRHRPGSYQWFKAAVPNCGNIVTICDEEQQVMGEAEIVTACEVTEAHFLSIDNVPSVPRCNKCNGYSQQNQNGNWFGSTFGQQSSGFQQTQPCFQQQQPCFQQQQPCFQQQPSCFQQQQRNCGRNSLCSKATAKPRSCLKCQDQNQSRSSVVYSQKQPTQQTIIPQMHQSIQQMAPSEQIQSPMQHQPVQQEPIEETNYCLTEMLAEELKKQMLAAQAQIAQVQLQLNSACGATRVRQMHVLTQNANEAPHWAPETQFLGSLEDIQGDAPLEEVRENGEEDEGFSMQLDQQSLPSHFNCSTLGSIESNKMWPGISAPQPSQQAVQLGMYPVPVRMSNQGTYIQSDPQTFPCQQQQQQMIPCQQIQQMPPCQQQYRAPPFPPQKPPPCQQKQQRLSCQQQQQTMRSGQPSQSNKCSHAPQFCPSCCCQRYAQMRFMMPRCWPR